MTKTTQFNLRIPQMLKEEIMLASQKSGRSVNAEAQARLEDSFYESGEFSHAIQELQQLLATYSKPNKKTTLAEKLNLILTNITCSGFEYTLSAIAYDMQRQGTYDIVEWFDGVREPSLDEQRQLSHLLYCNNNWLSFDIGTPYSIQVLDTEDEWDNILRQLLCAPKKSGRKTLYFLCNHKTTEVLIVKNFHQWHTETYYASGVDLSNPKNRYNAILFILFNVLSKIDDLIIRSVILNNAEFEEIKTGKGFPLKILAGKGNDKWASDFYCPEIRMPPAIRGGKNIHKGVQDILDIDKELTKNWGELLKQQQKYQDIFNSIEKQV